MTDSAETSSVCSSDISRTDVHIFRNLANQATVNVEQLPTLRNGRLSAEAARALEHALAGADVSSDEPQPTRHKESRKRGASFSDAVASVRAPASHASKSRKKARYEASPSSDIHAGSVMDSDDGALSCSDEQLDKQNCLIELNQLAEKGARLSRSFSMDDSLAELEFEVSRQNALLATASAVTFMRDSLRLGISGIEILNGRLGPFLKLDGWANSVCSDMHKYDRALERLAKQYFRKSTMSPIVELAMLLGGSLLMWHFKGALFGAPSMPMPGSFATSTAFGPASTMPSHPPPPPPMRASSVPPPNLTPMPATSLPGVSNIRKPIPRPL